MKRLIKAGLIYGNLFHVDSAALVGRYNRALGHLTGKKTGLTDFYIDISGFSPEVGDALNDPLYLNPNGCNRQFILLSPKQKTAPLLHPKFSTSRRILRQFIGENEPQLFALTARDAVAGEMVNSVYNLDSAAKLFRIRQVEIEADTTRSHIEEAETLLRKIKQFETQPDAWWDEALIGDMIELAKVSGDILQNPVALKHHSFRQDSFYSDHFGGIYIFRDLPHPAAISVDDPDGLGALPIDETIGFDDRNEIARFLEKNDLVESIISTTGLDTVALLQTRLDFILVDTAAHAGEDLTGLDRMALRRATRRYLGDLPEAFHALGDLLRWVETGNDWPKITSEHPAYFYTLRAAQGAHRNLVNMLLSDLCPLDFRQLFICHKEAFYRAYRTWPEAKKSYVVDFLSRTYIGHKAATRAALFGVVSGKALAATPKIPKKPKKPAPKDDLIRRVGPWGAVRRD